MTLAELKHGLHPFLSPDGKPKHKKIQLTELQTQTQAKTQVSDGQPGLVASLGWS